MPSSPRVWATSIQIGLALGLCVGSASSGTVDSASLVQTDIPQIVQKSLAANQNDWNAAPKYSYVERDADHRGSRTYRVLQLSGSPYNSLLAVNDQPLSPAEEEREQRKLQQATKQRQDESAQDHAERVAKYQKDRTRDHLMMEQLTRAFDFSLLGEQKLDGVEVYVLSAKPRPGYRPPNLESKALTGMEGKLWIDKRTFQWVKVEAEVVHPVSMEGFLARVEPGTRFELEQMPVGDGIWLPKHFAMKSRARVIFVPRKGEEDQTYSEYQKGNP